MNLRIHMLAVLGLLLWTPGAGAQQRPTFERRTAVEVSSANAVTRLLRRRVELALTAEQAAQMGSIALALTRENQALRDALKTTRVAGGDTIPIAAQIRRNDQAALRRVLSLLSPAQRARAAVIQ